MQDRDDKYIQDSVNGRDHLEERTIRAKIELKLTNKVFVCKTESRIGGWCKRGEERSGWASAGNFLSIWGMLAAQVWLFQTAVYTAPPQHFIWHYFSKQPVAAHW